MPKTILNDRIEDVVALICLIIPISKKQIMLVITLTIFGGIKPVGRQVYYTGIDLHKFTSYLTTVDSSGNIIKRGCLIDIICSGC